jgi:hypothetical protein
MSGGWRGWGCKLQAPQEETTGAFYDTSTLMEVGWSWLSFLFALILHASQATITCPDDQDVIQSFDEVISSSGCPSLALESPAKIAASDFTICCDQQKICYQTCSLVSINYAKRFKASNHPTIASNFRIICCPQSPLLISMNMKIIKPPIVNVLIALSSDLRINNSFNNFTAPMPRLRGQSKASWLLTESSKGLIN